VNENMPRFSPEEGLYSYSRFHLLQNGQSFYLLTLSGIAKYSSLKAVDITHSTTILRKIPAQRKSTIFSNLLSLSNVYKVIFWLVYDWFKAERLHF